MTIKFTPKSDKYPAKLTFEDGKIAPTDRIVFLEAFFKLTDDSVTFFGFLSSQSLGLTNYKDKDWKPEGQEALLTIYKSKKQQWNDSIKKYEQVEVSTLENYLFSLLSSKLKSLDILACICVSLTPYVAPMFFEMLNEQAKPGLTDADFQAQARLLEKMTENTCVTALVAVDKLDDSHRQLLGKAGTTATGGSAGTWGSNKGETESEKLESRWQFVKKHLTPVGQFETIGDVAIAVVGSGQPLTAAEQVQRDCISESISILSQLLP